MFLVPWYSKNWLNRLNHSVSSLLRYFANSSLTTLDENTYRLHSMHSWWSFFLLLNWSLPLIVSLDPALVVSNTSDNLLMVSSIWHNLSATLICILLMLSWSPLVTFSKFSICSLLVVVEVLGLIPIICPNQSLTKIAKYIEFS